MNASSLALIGTALLPVLITAGAGIYAGFRKDFAWGNAGILTKLVMLYALPLSLFSGLMETPRKTLVSLGPLALVLISALILAYFIPLLFARYVFKRDLGTAALEALAIGSPAVPFIGTTILPVLFGATASVTLVAVAGLPQNIIQLPVTIILLSVATGAAGKKVSIGKQIVNAVKQPVVWAPILAAFLVICGVTFPAVINNSLAVLGKATSGLSLFAAGIVIFSKRISFSWVSIVTAISRNIIVPGVLLLLLLAIHFPAGELRQVVMTMSIPVGPIVIIMAMQYHYAEKEMASTMGISMVASLLTMGSLILALG